MRSMEIISIIVPVYNSEQYLRVCLDSILTQTYRNLDIILIDDGSTDASGDICDAYAAKDSRIRVFHNTNHGVSYSRNCGIKVAKGEYLLFIDSDDTVNFVYVEELVQYSDRYDLVIANIEDVYERSSRKRKIPKKTGILEEDYSSIIEFLRVPVSKLYRTFLIKKYKIYFPEGIDWAEDQIFNWKYYQRVSTYKFVLNAKYQYNHRKDGKSLSQQVWKADDLDLMKIILKSYKDFLVGANIKYKDKLMCDRCLDNFMYAGSGYALFAKRCRIINEFINKKYSASNWKRKLVLKCLQYRIYPLIYVYYRMKYLLHQ